MARAQSPRKAYADASPHAYWEPTDSERCRVEVGEKLSRTQLDSRADRRRDRKGCRRTERASLASAGLGLECAVERRVAEKLKMRIQPTKNTGYRNK